MSPRPSLTLVVPCFNEAHRFPGSEFGRFLENASDTGLVFVDDGSTDGTGALLADLADQHPDRCVVLTLERNRGKAEAVRRGLLEGLARETALVGFWDADLATPLTLVESFVDVFERRPDVQWVIGSRVRLLGRRIDRHAWRHYAGRVFATAVALWLGVPVYDTQCGAKVFRAGSELTRLLADPFLSRWIFDVELIARLIVARGRSDIEDVVVELPLEAWTDVGGSKVGARTYLRALWDFVHLASAYRLR